MRDGTFGDVLSFEDMGFSFKTECMKGRARQGGVQRVGDFTRLDCRVSFGNEWEFGWFSVGADWFVFLIPTMQKLSMGPAAESLGRIGAFDESKRGLREMGVGWMHLRASYWF